MRILIIEDNKELALVVKEGLIKASFTVDLSFTGCDGEEKAFVNEYDVILLDLNLPDKDGLTVLRFLRSENIITPIIIITARNEVEQRAQGLNDGADDYIVKPFEILELTARINAMTRRFYGRAKAEIVVGSLHINPGTRRAFYNDELINLSAREFDILEYVASCSPAVVSGEQIAEHVYDEFYDSFSSVLRVHISNLKKKLRAVIGKEMLQTIKGKGYYICDE